MTAIAISPTHWNKALTTVMDLFDLPNHVAWVMFISVYPSKTDSASRGYFLSTASI
jgi:hypothetical protein